jgi:hypothetical protein
MNVYEESDLRFHLQEIKHFRFEDLKTYQTLKSSFMKEMDFTFFYHKPLSDEKNLYFVEVKSFSKALKHQTNDALEERLKNLPNELTKKIQDTLLMMSSAWLNIGKGANLKDEIDTQFKESPMGNFFFIVALDLPPPLNQHFGHIQDRTSRQTASYSKLFDCKNIVINYERLQKDFPFITQVSPNT